MKIVAEEVRGIREITTEHLIALVIEIDGRKYTVGEREGKLEIRTRDHYMAVFPRAANTILVKEVGYDEQ